MTLAIPSRKHRFGSTRSGFRDERGLITMDIIEDVIKEAPRSVTKEMIKRFDDWGRQQISG